ncbi:MAG: hypothetical protein HQ495_02365 [Alphaproteobacteria bacterium]|nr:hypothetical protein [Alphaproteobacteria bacterium]
MDDDSTNITIPKHCYGCGSELTDENDSAAHIIPNALGGRLAPRGIICGNCNGVLDRIADNPLLQTFAQWPTLLNIPRQRASHPPVTVEDSKGNEYRVEADGSRTIARPEYEQEAIDEDHKVKIRAPTWKQVDQLIGRAAKQFPQLDPIEARQHARVVSEVPRHQWKIRMNFAPNVCFPGVMSALWLFHIHKIGKTFFSWDELQAMISEEVFVEKLRYMPDGFPGLTGPTPEISHKLIIKSVGAGHRQLVGYAEILGVLRIGGVICDNNDDYIEEIYVADPFSKDNLSSEFTIDNAAVEATDWSRTGVLFDPATAKANLLPRLLEAAKVLQTAWQEREANGSAGNVQSIGE